MSMVFNYEQKYKVKKLEQNALLEVTQAINNNLPEDVLYKIFSFTLIGSFNIQRFALYVFDDDNWICKTHHGTEYDYIKNPIDKSLFKVKKLCDTKELNAPYKEDFDVVFPVLHKDRVLAYMLVSRNQDNAATEEQEDGMNFVQALSNIILVAIENKKLARRQLQEEAYRKELEIARNVQQFLFPSKLPKHKPLQIEASYLPHHLVGGDYYDYIAVNETKFLLCIADVSGKGVPAAILMSNFQASLRTMIRQTTDLASIVKELNYQILKNANGENFITAFLALYDCNDKTLHYVNAGHNPPVLIRKDKKVELLEKGSTILGVLDPLPFLNDATLSDLDEFFFFSYTDGLTETFNEEDEAYGLDRLQDFLLKNHHMSLNLIHKGILDDLDNFRGSVGYSDDITMLSCSYKSDLNVC